MDDRTLWSYYFMSVCGIRFHPKNDDNNSIEAEVNVASDIADAMLLKEKHRWRNE